MVDHHYKSHAQDSDLEISQEEECMCCAMKQNSVTQNRQNRPQTTTAYHGMGTPTGTGGTTAGLH